MRSIFSGIFCLFLLLGTANFAYSQDKNEVSNYHLPPGYRLNPEKIIFDLSGKIDGNFSVKDLPDSKLRVLKEISVDELKDAPAEYQEYVNEGGQFISSLSSKVKSIYTETELWYIYAFDQKLKMKLTKIK